MIACGFGDRGLNSMSQQAKWLWIHLWTKMSTSCVARDAQPCHQLEHTVVSFPFHRSIPTAR